MKKGIAFLLLTGWACLVLCAQNNPFVTVWELPTDQEQLEFYLTRTGQVDYDWAADPSGQTGSDAFKPGDGLVRVSSLPAGNTIILSIYPENLDRFYTHQDWPTTPDAVLLKDIKRWGDVAWKSMEHAFYECGQMTSTANDLPNLDEVTSMSNMFAGCDMLNGPPNINDWDVSNVTNMAYMFRGAINFNQDIGKWVVSNVTRMEYMFRDASSFNRDIGKWDVANVTRMDRLFKNASAFNQDIGDWDVSNATTLVETFRNAVAFDQDIGHWNVSNVTNMQETFRQATAFNQNINDWNVANVDRTSDMFYDATSFNQPLDKWDTSELQRAQNMFRGATAFNQDLSAWDVSKLRLMQSMFQDATSFNQCLQQWDVSSATNMGSLFAGATAFNQHIGNWKLQSLSSMENMLDNCSMDCDNYSATLIGWAASGHMLSYRTLGASGRQYGSNAEAARHYLITTMGWIINEDASAGVACLLPGAQPNRFIKDQTLAEGDMLCYDATSTIAVHDLTVQAGAFVDYIAGERIIFKPGVVVQAGGYLSATIRAGAPYCKEKSDLQLTVFQNEPDIAVETTATHQEISPGAEAGSFIIYPNPTKGKFTVRSVNDIGFSETTITVYSLHGKTTIQRYDTDGLPVELDLTGIHPGIYLVVVNQANTTDVKKLIIY